MTDAELEAIHERWNWILLDALPTGSQAKADVRALYDEVKRMRGIVEAVAALDRMEVEDGACPFCGLVDWEDRNAPHISRFGSVCPVVQARALLEG